jgi:transposase
VTTVTVLSGPERRRRWSTSEKLRIVEESLAPGASVAEVARRYDVHRNLVTLWRRQARTGVLACGPEPMQRREDEVRFAAVSVAPDRQPLTASSGTCGAIEIEFAAGARMRITGAVDAATLTAVVAALTDGQPR